MFFSSPARNSIETLYEIDGSIYRRSVCMRAHEKEMTHFKNEHADVGELCF